MSVSFLYSLSQTFKVKQERNFHHIATQETLTGSTQRNYMYNSPNSLCYTLFSPLCRASQLPFNNPNKPSHYKFYKEKRSITASLLARVPMCLLK